MGWVYDTLQIIMEIPINVRFDDWSKHFISRTISQKIGRLLILLLKPIMALNDYDSTCSTIFIPDILLDQSSNLKQLSSALNLLTADSLFACKTMVITLLCHVSVTVSLPLYIYSSVPRH